MRRRSCDVPSAARPGAGVTPWALATSTLAAGSIAATTCPASGRRRTRPWPTRTTPPSRGAAASRPWRSAATAGSSTRPARAPTVADPDQSRRNVDQFSIRARAFTGRVFRIPDRGRANLVADMAAVGRRRMVVIERDAGSGANALLRRIYRVEPPSRPGEGGVPKTELVGPRRDPRSRPRVAAGSFIRATWGSATRSGSPASPSRRCTPSAIAGSWSVATTTCRTPAATRRDADDNEFILVDVPGLRSAP